MPFSHLPMISIHIGEIAVDARAVVVRTVLGSCVSACLYDPVVRVGGVNHFLLPQNGPGGPAGVEARFGVHAMELLINAMMDLGARRTRLIAKGFGGANVIPGMSSPTAGERNVAFLRHFLKAEHIHLTSHHFGGEAAMQLVFHTESGRAFVRQVGQQLLRKTIFEETHAASAFPGSEVTLF